MMYYESVKCCDPLLCVVWDMKVVRSSSCQKQANFVRKRPCGPVGLRICIQTIFAIITVVSFIMIVSTTIKPSSSGRPGEPTKCVLQSCTVICHGAPDYGKYEEHILVTIAEGSSKCHRLNLELIAPNFENRRLPKHFLSRIRSDVIYNLSIRRGNLKYLTNGAFMTTFGGKIEILAFDNLTIAWEPYSLVGLSNLQILTITETRIEYLGTNVIRPVDDTLKTLVVTNGGNWDPMNLTGFRGLEVITTVDLSQNDFNDVLTNNTFNGLEHCKFLYLNNCKITSIAPNTFDALVSIEVLYLNSNYLTHVPPGLFSTILMITNPRPRINIHNNLWHCSCDYHHLEELVTKEVLLVEAMCRTPIEVRYTTFTDFFASCTSIPPNIFAQQSKPQNSKIKPNSPTITSSFAHSYIKTDQGAYGSYCEVEGNRDRSKSMLVVSPDTSSKCTSLSLKNVSNSFSGLRQFNESNNWSNWLEFSILLQTETYIMLQLGTTVKLPYGLLWYQSMCPNEIYCVDTVPSLFRLYNINFNIKYTFCPFDTKSGLVENYNCVNYDTTAINSSPEFKRGRFAITILAYIITGLLSLLFGAGIVYGVIRKNPNLLRGSKRILFVKHKTVDALVMPPKVPLRTNLLDENKGKLQEKIFTVCTATERLPVPKFNTMKSIKSNQSYSPSYISALQPTEDQLAEWRKNNTDLNDNSLKSETSSLSWVRNSSYYSLDESDTTYESLK